MIIMTSINVNSCKINWRKDPPFLNSRVIEISFPLYDQCPNKCEHIEKECIIYGDYEKEIERFQNPISTNDLLSTILKNYIKNPNAPHPNIIMFKGDLVIKKNFQFIFEFLDMLETSKVGMFIGAETYGSVDKEILPKLLSTEIIDELIVKIAVYNEINDFTKLQMEHVFNSLSQSIDAITHISYNEDIPDNDLKRVGIAFLFTKESSLDVFLQYLSSIYDAFCDNDDVFNLFDIYLRGDGTEPKGILEKAFENAIQGFNPDKIYMIPIQKKKDECLFYNS